MPKELFRVTRRGRILSALLAWLVLPGYLLVERCAPPVRPIRTIWGAILIGSIFVVFGCGLLLFARRVFSLSESGAVFVRPCWGLLPDSVASKIGHPNGVSIVQGSRYAGPKDYDLFVVSDSNTLWVYTHSSLSRAVKQAEQIAASLGVGLEVAIAEGKFVVTAENVGKRDHYPFPL